LIKLLRYHFAFAIAILHLSIVAQNETNKWYFGNYAGLDFMSNPPTILTNGAMQANYGCASIADASGNLLFYTNGTTVYDASHSPMANGTGLFGIQNGSQPSLIIKKPGSSTLYYIFTISSVINLNSGFHYSIVDMSLASGQGSVTVKNTFLYTGHLGGKLTGTKHCNGVDYWVVVRDFTLNSTVRNFRSYLLTSTGITTVAVISSAQSWTNNLSYYDQYGCMKISPNGKKLALANYYYNNNNNQSFELHDFDNSTGIVSNSLSLGANTWTSTNIWNYGWGVEFSPDGTKLFGSRLNNNVNNNYAGILQWDLCAGSPSAIAASETVIANTFTTGSTWNYHGTMQLATNGKIYVANWYSNNQSSISVINNPNLYGAACNYSYQGQSISPKSSTYSLPNFIGSFFAQPPPVAPFTHTVSNSFGCQGAGFTSPVAPNTTVTACSSIGYSLTNLVWDFGDPNSGNLNTSTAANPVHAFTTLGNYTVTLILYYSCGGGTDTLRQPVNINMPCISVVSNSITCASLGSATVSSTGGIGPFSYTWMPSGQTNSVATGLSPGTYTLTVFDFGNNFTYTATTVFTSLIPLTGNMSNSSSLTCNGVNNGTATINNLSGGSGNEVFSWSNGAVTYTTQYVSTLSAGLWSVNVTDALTGCAINDIFLVTQPPASTLNLSASTPSSCVGTGVVVTGTNSGGTPGYTYTWTAGPSTDSMTATGLTAGNHIYTLNSTDALNCLTTNTIAVTFVSNPVLTVSDVSICPLQTGTLSISGASTYTWNNNNSLTGGTFTDNPVTSTLYSVVGSAFSCTSSATASIILKSLPAPISGANSPICNSQNLQLYANGGASYTWSGPLNYSSNQQNPVISSAAPNRSGVYTTTVTALNSCTATASVTVVVNPTPTLSVTGSTVCTTQPISLTATSLPGATYLWSGPGSFSDLQQNPVINNPAVANSGQYSVVVTSAVGCSNTAVANVTVTQVPTVSFTTNSPRCYGTTLTLNGTSNSAGNNFTWTGPNGFSSASQNTVIAGVPLAAAGDYTLTAVLGPCTAVAVQNVVINPLPVPSASINGMVQGQVCEGKTILFTVNNNNYGFQWQGPAGFTRVIQNPQISNAKLKESGIYTVTVTDLNQCKASSEVTVSVMPNPTVTATGTTVCRNQPATITASGAGTYFWIGPLLSVNDQSAAVVSIAPNVAPTAYTVIGAALNTCTGTAVALVNTRDLPTPSLTISKPRICLNGSVTLQGFGGSTYEWHGPGGINLTGSPVTFTAGSLSYSGEYTLTAADELGCHASTTTSLTIDDLPSGSLTGDKMEGCVPFCADFKFASGTTASSLIAASWEVLNKTFNSKNFTYCFTRAVQYTVKGNFKDTARQCVNTMTFAVYGHAQPAADFSYWPDAPVENTENVVFTNTSQGEEIEKWNWYFPSTSDNVPPYSTANESALYLFKEPGSFPVVLVVKNKWDCADTIIKTVQVLPDFHVYVPNAFTPNGDGRNDQFIPVSRGVTKYKIQVFNRYGELVFSSEEPESGWDGTYQGVECKQDVYNWRLIVQSVQGESREMTGSILLMK
jgi:gliding motility-associated-like protein